jgi:predicted 3-demethylubiquinone-9 3-methyltransferase (glyoxalase superfamily)
VAGRPKGTIMTVTFELEGQRFVALNGGPIFKFSQAISFLVTCETQFTISYGKNSQREENKCNVAG